MVVKRIVHVIEAIGIGGAEILLCNTVFELKEYEHIIISLFPPVDDSILPSNAKHICLYATSVKALAAKTSRYKHILKEFRPDIVHAHLYFATIFAKLFTPSSIPLLFTQHFEFSKNVTKWYYAAVDKLVSKKRQMCIAVSNAVLRDYLKSTGFCGETRVLGVYIPDYFFSIQKQTLQKQAIRLVALGNIKAVKNQRYLLDAFALLKDLPVSCDIYGEGPHRMQLEEEARKNNLALYFKGSIKDSATVLGSYDAYIMPSLTEGFPLALFESLAVGLPPIISDIPVFHELLGDLGMYLDLQQPGSLRKHIENLLQQSPQNMEMIASKARQLALEKASKKRYLEQLRAIYEARANNYNKSKGNLKVIQPIC